MKTLIVDIDGTICKTVNGDYANSVPILDRINYVNKLYDAGNTIIYWTARGSVSGIDWKDKTISQLAAWGCKFSELRFNKPAYDMWIDDKAMSDKEFFK